MVTDSASGVFWQENCGSTVHALHTAIDRNFHLAGIEGAYADMRVRLARESGRAGHALRAHAGIDARKQGAA